MISLSECSFGQLVETYNKVQCFYIKPDDKLKNRHLVAHPNYGALLYFDNGQCIRNEQTRDDIVRIGEKLINM